MSLKLKKMGQAWHFCRVSTDLIVATKRDLTFIVVFSSFSFLYSRSMEYHLTVILMQ